MQKTILPLLLLLASVKLLGQTYFDARNTQTSSPVVTTNFLGYGPVVPNRSTGVVWDFSQGVQAIRMDTFGKILSYPFTAPTLNNPGARVRDYPEQYFADNTGGTSRYHSMRAFVRANGQIDVYRTGIARGNFNTCPDFTISMTNGDSTTNQYIMVHVVTSDTIYVTCKTNLRARGTLRTAFAYYGDVAKYMVLTTFRSQSHTGPVIGSQLEGIFVHRGASMGWPVFRSREVIDAQGNVTLATSDYLLRTTTSNTASTLPWVNTFTPSITNFYNIAWPTPSVAYLCANGSGSNNLYKTTNTGTTWTNVSIATPNVNPTFVHALNNDTLLGVQGTQLFRSLNGGFTWTDLALSQGVTFPPFIKFAHAFSATEYLVLCDGLVFRRTTNGGQTWQTVNIGTLGFQSLEDYSSHKAHFRTMGDTIWFGTTTGRVFRSVDKGLNWAVFDVNPNSSAGLTGLAFKDAMNGLATDNQNRLYSTFDGGELWNLLPAVTVGVNQVVMAGRGSIAYLKGLGGRPGFYMLIGAASQSGNGTHISFDNGLSWIRFRDYVTHDIVWAHDQGRVINIGTGNEVYSLNNCINVKPVIWKNGCQLGGAMVSQNFYLPTPKWYRDGVEIPNSQGASYQITQSGSYQAAFIDPFQGCDQLSDPIVVSVTGSGCDFVISGLEDPIAETTQVGIELFPNPTYGPATLRFHESWAGLQKSVMVYDLAGRLVASLQTSDDQTELNFDAAAGFYMVTVQAENGQRANASLILNARR